MRLRHKKWWSGMAIVLLSVLIATVLLEPVTQKSAFAERVALTYDVAEHQWSSDKKYIGRQTLTTNTVLAKAGYTIKEAKLLRQGVLFKNLNDAVGQTSYTVQETLTGIDVPVYSDDNQTTQSYYAWYRYSKAGGPDRWFANFERLDSSYNTYGAQRACYAVDKDEFGMSQYPDLIYDTDNAVETSLTCQDTDLALVGSLEKDFKTGRFGSGTLVEQHVVDRTRASGTAVNDTETLIPGPEPTLIQPGYLDESSILGVYKVDLTYDYDIVVRFGQRFNFLSDYAANLPAYGAKLMVYYNAFTVDVVAYTYEYPYTLEVVYEPAAKPDLVPVGITTTGSVKIDELKTYTLQFKNQGVPVLNTPFRVVVRNLNTGVLVFDKHFSNVAQDQMITDTFTYATTSQLKVRFGLYVDYGSGKGAIDEGDSGGELNNYAEYEFPVSIGIDGNFDLVPPTIMYTDNFQVIPRPFEIPNSCTYQSHQYRFTQNGVTRLSEPVRSRTAPTPYNYPNYPDNLVVGTSLVALQIYTSCGNTGWINEKPLVIQPSDRPNTPPEFRAGFFLELNRNGTMPVSTVVQGAPVNLRIIEDPSSSPPSPYDAENDYPITWNWNFAGSSSNWIRGLPAQYGFDRREPGFYNIRAEELGNFSIQVTGTDRRGAAASRTVLLSVIPPNPVAVCSVPSLVKANRSIDPAKFSAVNSYSPTGAAIDHSRNEWINRQTSYANPTGANLTVHVQLWVYDTNGLKSLGPADCPIVVQPDRPPIGQLSVPPLGLRGQTYELYNKSYSPDEDVLVSATYRFKYDAANNGFDDDPWQPLAGDPTKATFTPSRVGPYLFDVTVCENYGQCGTARATQTVSTRTLNVINLAPTVAFTISGKNPQPDLNPETVFTVDQMLGWALYETNSTVLQANKPYQWTKQGADLVSGLGKGLEKQVPKGWADVGTSRPYFDYFTDNGFGPNGIAPYKGMLARDTSRSQPLLLPPMQGGNFVVRTSIDPTTPLTPVKYNASFDIQTTRTHLYFWTPGNSPEASTLMAYNKSRVPTYSSADKTIPGSYGAYEIIKEHYWSNGVNPYDLAFPFGGGQALNQLLPDQPALYSGGWSGGWRNEPARVEKFNTTLAGDRLLVLYAYDYATACYYWEEEDTGDSGYDCAYGPRTYALAQFDALTGALLDSGLSRPIAMPSFPAGLNLYTNAEFGAIGNNLIVYLAADYEPDTLVYMEFDPTGQIVRHGSFSQPAFNLTYAAKYSWGTAPERTYTCRWSGSLLGRGGGSYTDDEGNILSYRTLACYESGSTTALIWDTDLNPDQPTGTYLIKYNLADNSMTVSPRLRGQVASFTNWLNPKDTDAALVYNPFTKVAFTRTFTTASSTETFYQEVRMDGSGEIGDGPAIANWDDRFPSPFALTPSGDIVPGNCAYTASGTCERYDWHNGEYLHERSSGSGMSYVYSSSKAHRLIYGQFVGDGLYLSMYGGEDVTGSSMGSSGNETYDRYIFLDTGTVNPAEAYKGFRIGQLVSDAAFSDADLKFTMNLQQAQTDGELAGFSFRMQDALNRYAVETDGTNLFLSRYVAGSRTVLQSTHFPVQNRVDYTFQVKLAGEGIEVFAGGVPYFSVTDGTFASGKIGPGSDKSYVAYKAVSVKAISQPTVEWLTGYAIWEDGSATAEARYENITFTDPENDPRVGSNRWRYVHTPKFLNNQGLSALHGQTLTTEQLFFDKVGAYDITLQARDDPHPDYLYPSGVFDSYRKDSNAYMQRLIVHRRPVAIMSAWVNGDGTVGYSDESYDPDRWLSASNYSPPETPTFINYGATRGIMERKYYYITPSGQRVESKLTRPTATGTYSVGLMVRDEYGAWSYPVTTTVNVGTIPPANDPPTAILIYPTGTQASPNLISATAQPNIRWEQLDSPGTVFQGYHIKIFDESGAILRDTGERTQWTTERYASQDQDVTGLSQGVKYQVQVRVSDGEQWSEWSNIGWIIINSPPSIVLTFPNENETTSQTPAIIQGNRRPTITWNQYDPDLPYGQSIVSYLQIAGPSGFTYQPSEVQWTQATSRSFTVPIDLPTGVPLRVAVLVGDGMAWSEWSYGHFLINMPPSAGVTHPSGTQANPTIEGPAPTITWNQTDPDPNTVFQKYQLHIVNEPNTTVVYDSGEVSRRTSATEMGYTVDEPLPSGQKLRVRVRVFDGYVWSAWSADTWMMINRPPVADFDWSPKPVWEGDIVYLNNGSTDPDGDDLTSVWEIRTPGGDTRTHDTTNVVQQFAQTGTYSVTLTVSDGFAESRITKIVEALPLTIRSEVEHTSEWAAIHEGKGHNTTTVPKDFYSGEIFVVRTNSAPAPVAEASARIDATGMDGNRLAASVALNRAAEEPTRFEGRLFDDRFMSATEGLPEGVVPIHFRIVYENGVVRTEDVPVRIIGNANEAVHVFRRQ